MSQHQDTSAKEPKLKILMLHGYRQNEKAFRERSGGLRKFLKSHAEFYFIEAVHCVSDGATKETIDDAKLVETESNKGWWFSQPDGTYDALERTDCDLGFEKTLDQIDNAFAAQGPFDGVFGFSQGACLTGILCHLSATNSSQYPYIRFRFAILVAGFKSNQSLHDHFYDSAAPLSMPTLHVIGHGDKVIPYEMAKQLVPYFTEPVVFEHDEGHFIAVNGQTKSVYVDFLKKMRANKATL